jgi:single-strand DNA-binding protein
MLNVIVIHGRLTANPELKQTQSGVSVCTFTVAVDRSYSKDEKITDFFTVTAWRGLAEFVAKYFTKGKEIALQGEMQSRKWVDNDGNNRVSWEVLASSVDFCGSKSDTSEPKREGAPETEQVERYVEPLVTDEALPF